MGQNKSIFYQSVPQPDLNNLPLHMMETSESEEEIYNVEESEEDSKENLLKFSNSPMISSSNNTKEKLWMLTLQILFPFLTAGLGMVAAGIVLDIVQHWPVFVEINEIFILVPALLGLKGNLEMTLASRLSTAANMNKMDTRQDAFVLVVGNLSLVQCQGIVIGFLAAFTGILMGWMTTGSTKMEHVLLLATSSVCTASIASFVLGVVMVFVVTCSNKFGINPDNVATPIAASLGDLTTLGLLAWISSVLHAHLSQDGRWLIPLLITFYVLMIPASAAIAYRCADTRPILFSGWSPVLVAMLISSGGGLILDIAVDKFKGIAVFQPVMNGVGGNLVAVQASRMSTYLHKTSDRGQYEENDRVCVTPCSIFFSGEDNARTARVLLLLTIPGHCLFVYTISFFEVGHITPTATFLLLYLFAACSQVTVLLYVCRIMVFKMWIMGIDPDNSAIPYLTALGDLLGGAFLGSAFWFMDALNLHEFYEEKSIDRLSDANLMFNITSTMSPN